MTCTRHVGFGVYVHACAYVHIYIRPHSFRYAKSAIYVHNNNIKCHICVYVINVCMYMHGMGAGYVYLNN